MVPVALIVIDETYFVLLEQGSPVVGQPSLEGYFQDWRGCFKHPSGLVKARISYSQWGCPSE